MRAPIVQSITFRVASDAPNEKVPIAKAPCPNTLRAIVRPIRGGRTRKTPQVVPGATTLDPELVSVNVAPTGSWLSVMGFRTMVDDRVFGG